MAEVYYSRVLNVPAEQVWRTVSDFGGIAGWFPFIVESVLRDDAAPTQVGAVRDNTNDSGELITERLVAFSERDRSFTYDVIAGDFPMTDYSATLTVHDVTEDGRSFVVWTARYQPTGDDPDEIARYVRDGIFATCLASLEEVLGAARPS